MEFIKSPIPEVILIKPFVHTDSRGFFIESYRRSLFVEAGIDVDFIQDNHSKSSLGVLRGLHYQLDPFAQGKLVRCVRGCIYDVAVDIRCGSPTFGKWVGYELSENNKNMLYIPVGFAHGFLTMSIIAEILYKTTAEYSPAHDRGLLFDDPEVGIEWPDCISDLFLSEKDQKQSRLKNIENNFIY